MASVSTACVSRLKNSTFICRKILRGNGADVKKIEKKTFPCVVPKVKLVPAMKKFGILNGVNLDRLGVREPEIYGSTTLADLERNLFETAKTLGVEIECFQSNHEGALVDKIYAWSDAGFSGLVFNPGAFTHTSIALRDCIAGCKIPTIEVHISNVHAREDFRRKSLLAPVCNGQIIGLGLAGYDLALFWHANVNAALLVER